MLSMTGFGRAHLDAGGRQLAVEIRSVNHRTLDVKVRGRGLSAGVEFEIIRAVRAALARGSIQVSVEEMAPAAPAVAGAGVIERARTMHVALERLRTELGLAAPVDLQTVASFLRLEERERAGDQVLDWAMLVPALGEALAALGRARAQEGAALAAEIRARARGFGELVERLRTLTQGIPERAARRLQERVQERLPGGAGVGLDPTRLAQEVALLVDRLDVTEELARLDAHCRRLDELLGAPPGREGVGRPLEFLLQEVGRELNTLGTKSQDAEVSAVVIAGKAELEKIREQAQNIE